MARSPNENICTGHGFYNGITNSGQLTHEAGGGGNLNSRGKVRPDSLTHRRHPGSGFLALSRGARKLNLCRVMVEGNTILNCPRYVAEPPRLIPLPGEIPPSPASRRRFVAAICAHFICCRPATSYSVTAGQNHSAIQSSEDIWVYP